MTELIKHVKLTKTEKSHKYENMKTRVMRECYHRYNPAYIGTEIWDGWLGKEGRKRFYQWVDDHYYVIDEETIELDKDLLKIGNRIYSPETCLFLPKSVNSTLSACYRQVEEELPMGVRYGIGGGYCPITGSGTYATPEEAYEVNVGRVKAKLEVLAEVYYGRVPMEVYNAMLNWDPMKD